MEIPAHVRAAIDAGPIATIITIGEEGAPQVSMAWIGLEDDEVVIGTMFDQAKLRNLRRDPRVVVSFLPGGNSAMGLPAYHVLHGRARITEGGAPELLSRLAQTYIGPGTVFPPMPNPPAGWVTRITVDRVAGSGPPVAGG
jgi:PPOX class probable F420-dependent enzyme